MKNFFKFTKKEKSHEEKMREWHDSDLYKSHESIKLYWTPELIEWVGNENNPTILAVASCLINTWEYPSFMPSNPGDYSTAHKDNPILSYFISDLREMLETKSKSICPTLHHKIWISNYYMRFSSNNKNI